MKFKDLAKLYEKEKEKYGSNAFLYISEILSKAKQQHIKDYIERETKKGRKLEELDPEQSWRAFKGKNFEKLILYIIEDSVRRLGLKCTRDTKLDAKHLSEELSKVRRNLVVHYGKYDVIPDTDIVIYDPETYEIVAVVSCKITLRERIAQTAYWKLKLLGDPVTQNIKVFFVTPDEDGHLVRKERPSKPRIIVEHDTNGAYVLRSVEESERVKVFNKFLDDLRKVFEGGR